MWKEIPGYENYLINELGDIINAKRKANIKHIEKSNHNLIECVHKYKNNSKYEEVVLSRNGNHKRILLHRLVAIAFIPNPENKPFINHKNGIKSDNRIENLEWVTHTENMQHAQNELYIKTSNHHGQSLKIPVVQLDKKSKYIKSFESITSASVSIGVSAAGICAVCLKNRKSAGGFKWEYEADYKKQLQRNFEGRN